MNRYENREISKQEREQGLQEIEKSLDNEHKDEEIEGVIWHGKGGCDGCPQEGEFFELDKLPETHPNCRCSAEVKYKKAKIQPYIRIFIKDGGLRHVRYEVVDEDGNRTVRGLSTDKGKPSIYEKGEEDSHGISVDDKEYKASDKIFLTKEEVDKAQEHIAKLDEDNPKYNWALRNRADFTAEFLSTIGKDGCLGDYLSDEQKVWCSGSGFSEFVKCEIPEVIGMPRSYNDEEPDLEVPKKGGGKHPTSFPLHSPAAIIL